MELWYAPTSPFARKVRIAAHELGLADRIRLVEVNPWTDARLRALNPLSKVPTLVRESGEVLFDSLEPQALLTDTLTIGEVSVAALLGYLDFRWPERDWRVSRPRLAAWFQRLDVRPSMRETRHRLPEGNLSFQESSR